MDEPLGSSLNFSVWSKGSNVKTTVPTTTANMYAALDNISADTDKRLMSAGNRSSGKDQYISKGPSMERTYKQYSEGASNNSSQYILFDISFFLKTVAVQDLVRNTDRMIVATVV